MNFTTKTWVSSRRHEENPFLFSDFNLFISIKNGDTEIAHGGATRPLVDVLSATLPNGDAVRLFGELKASALWKEMLDEATTQANRNLHALLQAAESTVAA